MSISSRINKIISKDKDFVGFVVLNYVDKFIVFLLPLVVLYLTKDKGCYNSIEYIYSIANVILPFFLYISAYCFYGYKELNGDNLVYIKEYREYSSFTYLVILIIGLIGVPAITFSPLPIGCFVSLLILIRLVYLLYISYYNTYYRLIDKPSRILIYSIVCSLFSVLLSIIFSLDNNSILVAYFIPQLITVIIFTYPLSDISPKRFLIKYSRYVKKSLAFAWPVIINSTIIAFVMNYGKIYAYNNLSSYDMYNFSYVMRISMIIQMAHASMISFYGKDLYVTGFSASFYKRYLIVIGAAFILTILFLYLFNQFVSFDKLTIDVTTYLILLYTFVHCCGASIELFYGRVNMNRYVLYMSAVACFLFCVLIFVVKIRNLQELSLYMVLYSIVYFFLLLIGAFHKKLFLNK